MLFYIILITSIFNNYNTNGDQVTVTTKNWEKIEYVWPNQDQFDIDIGRSSEFFFINNMDTKWLNFTIDKNFINDEKFLKNFSDNSTIKLSFKFWLSALSSDSIPKPFINFGVIKDYDILPYKFPKSNDDNLWIPFEIYLSKKQLNSFQFDLKTYEMSGMAAIKDLQLEYQVENDSDGLIETKPLVKPSTAPPTNRIQFPKDCYVDFGSFNGYCAQDFSHDLNNAKEKLFKIDAIYESCFNIKFFSRIKSEVNILINGFGDSTTNTIKTFHPLIGVNETNIQNERLCISDYSFLQSGNFEITFQILSIKPNVPNSFAIYIEKSTENPKLKTQYYLSEMKKDFDNEQKWTDEWLINTPSSFELNENNIEFSARAYSKYIATTSLSSIWLEVKPDFFQNDAQIILTVNEAKDFHSFILKPKICTEYFHCIDVFTTKINTNDKMKTINFNFNLKPQVKYIKLMLEVEYFIPIYQTDQRPIDVKFSIVLNNFGNPCHEYQCGENGDCKVKENKPSCVCTNGYTGEFCNKTDFCLVSKNNKPAGQAICDTFPELPKCYNWKNSFRCSCDDDVKLTWNETTQDCEAVKVGDKKQWNVTDAENCILNPIGSENYFNLDFNGIVKTKNICLKINYVSATNSILEVTYKSKLVPGNKPFKYFLPKSKIQEDSVEVCIKDFRYYFEEDFTLSMKINNIQPYNWATFKIESIETILKKEEIKTIDLIPKWEKDKSTDFDKYLEVIPKIINSQNINYEIKSLKLGKNDFTTISYVSKWINADPYFENSNSEIYYKIDFAKTNWADFISVENKILYYTDNKNTNFDDLKVVKKNEKDTLWIFKLENIPKNIYNKFKIIIDLKITTKTEESFDLSLKTISIGDPCYSKLGEEDTCKPLPDNTKTLCTATSPDPLKGLKCNCQNRKGKFCQWSDDACDGKALANCESYTYEFSNNEKCNQISSNDYQCSCPQKFFKWTNKTCIASKKFEKKIIKCNGSSCPFFSSFTDNFTWASDQLPKLDNTNRKEFFPFYYTNKKENILSFTLPRQDIYDICMNLKYSSTGDSKVSVLYNGNNPIVLPKSIQNTKKELFSEQKICVSELVEPLVNNMTINVKLETKIDFNNIAVLHHDKDQIEIFDKKHNDIFSPLSYLIQLNDTMNDSPFKPTNQWPLRIPNNPIVPEWVVDSPVQFTAQYSGERQSYIFSHWLKANTDNIMFRSNITNINNENDFGLEFLLYDNKLSAKSLNLIQFDSVKREQILKNQSDNEVISISIPKQPTAFRFAIKVSYVNVTSGQVLFQLKGMDIGDPCVIDFNQINPCSNNGICERTPTKVSGYTCICNIDKDTQQRYTGNNCQSKDYCKSPDIKNEKQLGVDVCHQYNSTCTLLPNGYQCNCPDKSKYWEPKDNKCIPIPQCLSLKCDAFKTCSQNPNENATCTCMEDYVKNNVTEKCELFDSCNKHHIFWKENKDEDRCTMESARCLTLSFGKNSKYDCSCSSGYEKIGDQESTQCNPIICKNKWMNKCDQICVNNITNKAHPYNCSCYESYIQEGDTCKLSPKAKTSCKSCNSVDKYCDSDGQCQCKQGYIRLADNSCKAEITDTLCPTHQLTNDSSRCDCGPNYKYNAGNFTCDLIPICGKGSKGREVCGKDKICIIDTAEPEFYRCECPSNMHLQDNKCVDNCEFMRNTEKCASRNAICNPYNTGEFCECLPGFEMKKFKGQEICLVNQYSSSFNLEFKNEFKFSQCEINVLPTPINVNNFTYDLARFVKDSHEADQLNQEILDKISSKVRLECFKNEILPVINGFLSTNTEKINSIKNTCNEEKSGVISCSFSIIFKDKPKKDTNIFDNLKSSCIPFGDQKQCFIRSGTSFYSALTKSPKTQEIVVDYNSIQKLTLNLNKGCGEVTDKYNPCPSFSNCVPDTNTTYYNCTCDKKFFKLSKPAEQLYTATGQYDPTHRIEFCEERNLCPDTCLNNGNNCVQKAIKGDGGNWKVQYACNCHGQMRNNITACTESCSKVECKNGVTKIKGEICQCECNEGYYGEACKSESSTSKGGWIAGIVVLAVLVVILAGVAFMFARRSRNNSTEYSGRPMDDYTGSSYRVPPNQSRGQQNPTFTRE